MENINAFSFPFPFRDHNIFFLSLLNQGLISDFMLSQ